MSGIKSLAYNKILTSLNIEASIHMYNTGRNVRSVIFVESAKNSNFSYISCNMSILRCFKLKCIN